jgi:hypothetical protein
MKHIFKSLAALIAIFSISGCSPEIPKEIRKEHREFIEWRENTTDRSTPDVQLPPIETVPVQPAARSLAAGNVGYDFLEVDEVVDVIRSKATRPVEVFVFDTGEPDHPALAEIIRGSKSYTGEPTIDRQGHSTHVAGTIGGAHNGSRKVGIATVLREMGLIHIRPYKVLTNAGSGSYSQITRGIYDANDVARQLIADGHFVVYNFSLGGPSSNSAMDAALKEAQEIGVLVVAANGNSGSTRIKYPGSSKYTQGIAAIDRSGNHAYFSDAGPQTVWAMPGVGIYSTYLDGRHAELNGTSMATPHAAAVASIIGSVYPEATASEVRQHMIDHATDLGPRGRDDKFGFGVPKLTDVLSDQPDDTPDDPGDPDQPNQPEDPEMDERTHTFVLPAEYTVYWRTRAKSDLDRLLVKVTVSAEHRTSLVKASNQVTQTAAEFFTRRGLILTDGSDEADAAFWAVRFFDVVNKAENMAIVRISYKVGGNWLCLDQFDRLPASNKKPDRHHGNITFAW